MLPPERSRESRAVKGQLIIRGLGKAVGGADGKLEEKTVDKYIHFKSRIKPN